MEENPLYRVISVDPEGRLYIDNQVVDSDMILFEEEAKNLLEQELSEGPHNSYYEEEELFWDDDDFEIIKDNDQLTGNEDISFGSGFFDINDEFDAYN